jgi:transcriptional regulator with XRE-family HTH domain
MSASQIDAWVGQRLRERREALGLSQGRLGRHLGLTFSQVQKYEKGSNRIGAGRLFQIAEFLGVSTSYFYDGLASAEVAGSVTAGASANVASEEVRALVASFASIADQDTRASVLALVRSLTSFAPANPENAR